MEKNAEYGGQPEILAPVHVKERSITVHCEDSDKDTVFGECFTGRPSMEIFYYPEERDDKGELIKAGHYMLLRRSTLLSQPENDSVYSLGDYVAFAQKQLIGSCVNSVRGRDLPLFTMVTFVLSEQQLFEVSSNCLN